MLDQTNQTPVTPNRKRVNQVIVEPTPLAVDIIANEVNKKRNGKGALKSTKANSKQDTETASSVYLTAQAQRIVNTLKQSYMDVGRVVYESRTSEYKPTLEQLSAKCIFLAPELKNLLSVSKLSECYTIYTTIGMDNVASYEKVINAEKGTFEIVKTSVTPDMLKGVPFQDVVSVMRVLRDSKGKLGYSKAAIEKVSKALAPKPNDADVLALVAEKQAKLSEDKKATVSPATVLAEVKNNRVKALIKPADKKGPATKTVKINDEDYAYLAARLDALNASKGKEDVKFNMADMVSIIIQDAKQVQKNFPNERGFDGGLDS